MEADDEIKSLNTTWQKIYEKNSNNIGEEWRKCREHYTNRERDRTTLMKFSPIRYQENGVITANKYTVNIPTNLMEHYSAVFGMDNRPIYDMEQISFTKQEVYDKNKKI